MSLRSLNSESAFNARRARVRRVPWYLSLLPYTPSLPRLPSSVPPPQFRGGPITVAEFMAECLTHPTLGYYMKRDVFGVAGAWVGAALPAWVGAPPGWG